MGVPKSTKQSTSNLNNLFNYALPQAQSSMATGTQATDQALNYFQKLTSGNRTAMDQAIAPARNAINTAGDASRRQQANLGTARGGGVNATNQQQKTTQDAAVDSALLQAQPEAAKAEATIGQSQTQDALAALGIGTQAAGAEGGVSNQSSENNQSAFQKFLSWAI